MQKARMFGKHEKKMRKQHVLGFLICLCLGLTSFAEVINKDQPIRGRYVLPVKNAWRIAAADGEPFGMIRQIRVSEDGEVIVHDIQAKRFHLFAPDRKFIHSFGKKGAGPGEIKMMEMAGLFALPGKWVVADIDQLHFFSLRGDFIYSTPNHLLRRRPVYFLDESHFLSAPLFRSSPARGDSAIRLINLKNHQTRQLAAFTPLERPGAGQPGSGRRMAMAFRGVTPMMVVGCDGRRLYYGMNHQYRIHVMDLSGNHIQTFGIRRDKQGISTEAKKQLISRGGAVRIPAAMQERILQRMPDEATYFDAIDIHQNLVWVWNSDPGMKNRARVDIFSPQGQYLYRGLIQVEKEYTILPLPIIRKANLYLILLDGKGDYMVAKYAVKSPAP